MTESRKYKRLPLKEDGTLYESGFSLKSPTNMVMVSFPKSGKTLSLVNVPKVLIVDVEDGTETFEARNVTRLYKESMAGKFVSTKKYGYMPESLTSLIEELYMANNMKEYWEAYNKLLECRDISQKEVLYKNLVRIINEMSFPIVCIDTLTSLTEYSNAAALYEYNINISVDKRKSDIKKIDDWGGVYKIRHKFDEVKRFIEQNAAPFIIYSGHISNRKKILKKGAEDISVVDIALEGILSTTITSQAKAVCIYYRNDEGCFLDFTKKDETDMGSRNAHLSNRVIKITDIADSKTINEKNFPLKTYWEEIYPEINFKQ